MARGWDQEFFRPYSGASASQPSAKHAHVHTQQVLMAGSADSAHRHVPQPHGAWTAEGSLPRGVLTVRARRLTDPVLAGLVNSRGVGSPGVVTSDEESV